MSGEQDFRTGHSAIDRAVENFVLTFRATYPDACIFVLVAVPNIRDPNFMDAMLSGNLEPEDVTHYLDQIPDSGMDDRVKLTTN